MFLKCLSSCDLNLYKEQEDIIRTCLGNLLDILIDRHLKLLDDSVPSQPMFTCDIGLEPIFLKFSTTKLFIIYLARFE